MKPSQTGSPAPETLDALATVVGLLDGARLAAEAAAHGDNLSPWANVAMSAHLAAAGLRQLLPWPQPGRPSPSGGGRCCGGRPLRAVERR